MSFFTKRAALTCEGAIAVLSACWLASALALSRPAQAQSHPAITKETFDQWMTELSNWGRWGKDDELGAINLIMPAKRKQAAALVKEGVSFSLSRSAEKEKAADNPAPFGHQMIRTGINNPGTSVADTFFISHHGYAHTHMDSLCHFFYKGKMYNGFPQEMVTERGAAKNAIFNFKNGIFTRGVLMDIPRLKGVEYLEPGTPIYPEDLDAWEKKARVRVGAGDVVFIRTGRWALRDAKGPWEISHKAAGLYASCARWLKSRDAAMVGSDAASDVLPSGVEGVTQPIHTLVLVAMGMPIFDNCDLELISKEANRRQRWDFLITAAPLAVPGATGSALNPIATF
ncbi:MAG TPA: cyclase family protein [Bryobacterales bacterium]|nr:cyclase family protein [Bryobacterales bacterium]